MKLSLIFGLFKDNPKTKGKTVKKQEVKERNIKKERPMRFKSQKPGGLSSAEAQKRLKKYGENKLKDKKKNSAMKIFAGQFKDFLILILLASTVISLFMGEIAEAISIAVIILLNGIMGFLQEYRTEKTLEALKNMSAPSAKVFRDGKLSKIPATEIVVDDEILVETGDRIPADAVLVDTMHMQTDESILTGESEPVEKKEDPMDNGINELNKPSMVYMGTTVVKGHARARVVSTGMKTQMGSIAQMLSGIEESPTPLQQRLDQLGKYIIFGCLLISGIVFITGIMRGEELLDMIITAVSLAVAAVPEGLPAIVTIVLALSVKRMVKKKALVRKLHAVETLGCANVICSDKTGTLTENKMTVKEVSVAGNNFKVSGDGYKFSGGFTLDGQNIHASHYEPLSKLLEGAVVCNHAEICSAENQNCRNRTKNNIKGNWEVMGEPTEVALLVMAAKGSFTQNEVKSRYKVIDELPFDSTKKSMTVFVKTPTGRKFAFVKGAYDVVKKRCDYCLFGESNDSFGLHRAQFDKENERMASMGMRVIAVAYREITDENRDDHLVFLGLCGMQDPPRRQAKKAVLTCKKAGIKTIMITGDHKLTAKAIAKQVGIYKENDLCITGDELDDMSDSALDENVKRATVFARVSPGHKLRIVKSLKRNGLVVAMTGDGVNDAPSVKEADIGVSMGEGGSDVTKQAADVVLLDDNFATLVSAIEEGRTIFDNIRKFIRYLLSCNIGEVVTMFFGMLIGMPVPLLPMQILMVNLVTDGLPAMALGLEPSEEGIMNRKPRSKDDSVFAGGLTFTIILRGILLGFTTLTVFTIIYRMSHSVDIARTATFLTLICTQLIHVFECKSETKSIFKIPYGNNKPLILASLLSLLLAIASVWAPQLNLLLKTCPLDQAQTMIAVGCSFIVPLLSAFILKIRNIGTN